MNNLHGWIVLDKPLGITSAKAVSEIKRALAPRKIGHGGTLDPLASGILPLALGEATKTVDYVMHQEKSYRFTIRFGEARTTDDAEGAVTATSDKRPTDADIEKIIPQFTGTIMQLPPPFSALKVGGKRAYDLARDGQEVTLTPRPIVIHDLRLIARDNVDHATFEVSCGRGTYIRALARDISQALGTVGFLSALRRTRVGKFLEKDAISLEKLKEFGHIDAIEGGMVLPLLSIERVLDDIPALALDRDQANALQQGKKIPLQNIADAPIALAMHDGKPVALVRVTGGQMQSVRGFHFED